MECINAAVDSDTPEVITRVEVKQEPCWQERMSPYLEESPCLQNVTVPSSPDFLTLSENHPDPHANGGKEGTKTKIKEEPISMDTASVRKEETYFSDADMQNETEEHACIVGIGEDFPPATELSRLNAGGACNETCVSAICSTVLENETDSTDSEKVNINDTLHGSYKENHVHSLDCKDPLHNEVSWKKCKEKNSTESKKLYYCKVCGKGFLRSTDVKRHNLIHDGIKPYKCKICMRSFTQLSSLKKHGFIHNGKRPHKCQLCEKSFSQMSYLKLHNLVHEGKRPHKCNICEKTFTRISSLKSHNLIHEGKRPYECDICNKGFRSSSDLKRHSLIHEGKRPHKCEICEKSFTRISTLKLHSSIHADERPFVCEICDKRFITPAHLKRHYVTHEDEKPHKCEMCDKTFTRISTLRLHNLIHEGKSPYQCEICEKNFLSASNMKRHYLTHEGTRRHL